MLISDGLTSVLSVRAKSQLSLPTCVLAVARTRLRPSSVPLLGSWRNLLIAIGVLFAGAVVAGWEGARGGSGGVAAVTGFRAVILGGYYVVLARSRQRLGSHSPLTRYPTSTQPRRESAFTAT